MKQRIRMQVRGRVQGVCFRMETRLEAERLGLTGWVRNCRDGSVELLAEGDETDISNFAKWCHRGPAMAMVRDVDESIGPATGEFDSFEISY